MKMRTVEQAVAAIDGDLAWRKRELTTAKFLWETSREHERAVARRAAVVLAYAHWEGFVKETSRAFLNFVHCQGLQYQQLQPGVLALTVKPRLKAAEDANRVAIHTSLVEFLTSGLEETAAIPWADACSDIGNMDSKAFESVARMLGIDFTLYATKSALMDERLVRPRHLVAHGVKLMIDDAEAEEARSLAISLMEKFRSDSENTLALGTYRR